jgi:hypothetical protein
MQRHLRIVEGQTERPIIITASGQENIELRAVLSNLTEAGSYLHSAADCLSDLAETEIGRAALDRMTGALHAARKALMRSKKP